MFATVLILVLPFVGGAGPSPLVPAANAESSSAVTAVGQPVGLVPTEADAVVAVAAFKVPVAVTAPVASTKAGVVDTEHLAQKPVPPPPVLTAAARASGTGERRAALAAQGLSCPGAISGSTGSAPGKTSSQGVGGTTTADVASFAANYNAIRVANCLKPVPLSHFRYDSCMETRLFWLAQDPHYDPRNTWGHIGVHSLQPDENGVYYSEAVPSVGCDGNLAGGSGMSGAGAATRWWNSTAHRNSLYRPSYTGSTAGICVYFAMSHGGVGMESGVYSYTRAAARWTSC